jgi:hypothetical protein
VQTNITLHVYPLDGWQFSLMYRWNHAGMNVLERVALEIGDLLFPNDTGSHIEYSNIQIVRNKMTILIMNSIFDNFIELRTVDTNLDGAV